ncbi:MAG: DegT/DnrJ/EryC1/StrS family aminotransferase [Bacteroidetes bacterium]|nr:DegT/DnrJ/EryC1/StrS family aminotransferase [Bacteroidota bacterium]
MELLKGLPQIELPVFDNNQNPCWHLFVIRAKKRDSLAAYLKDNNITTGIHYPIALPFLKAYEHLNSHKKDYPVAYNYQDKLISLPIFPEITSEQVEYVCAKICEFYNN